MGAVRWCGTLWNTKEPGGVWDAKPPLNFRSEPLQPGSKVLAPVFRKGRGVQRLLQQIAVIAIARKKSVHLGDGNAFGFMAEKFERVPRGDFAFLLHGKIKAAAATVQKEVDHIVALKFCSQLVTRHAGLTNHQHSRSDLKAIADMEIVFHDAAGCEILAERAPEKIEAWQFLSPVLVMLRRISIDGFVGTSVDAEIGLAVAIQVQPA